MPLILILIGLFVVVPAAEIATFIAVGKAIGILPTILLTFATAVAGATLMRRQGLKTLARLRAEMDAGRIPGETLGHGAMILLAGMLLLVPGFLSDIVGILLFLPPVRHLVWKAMAHGMNVTVSGGGRGPAPRGPRVVDLEPDAYRRTDQPSQRLPDDGSPWRPDGG